MLDPGILDPRANEREKSGNCTPCPPWATKNPLGNFATHVLGQISGRAWGHSGE